MEATPGTIETELREAISQLKKGVQALNEAENKLVKLNDVADRIEWTTYLENQGTIADRNALAKLEAADARLAAEIARIEVTRVKAKIKALETEVMAISVMAKQVAIEWAKA